MAEEIKEGDWISHPDGEGQIVSVSEEDYTVRPKGFGRGQLAVVAKGHRVKKITPPEEEE